MISEPEPLQWNDRTSPIPDSVLTRVRGLQGNIVRGHGYDRGTLIVVRLTDAVEEFLAVITERVEGCGVVDELERLQPDQEGDPDHVFFGVAFTASGLSKINHDVPGDGRFRAGMESSAEALGDSPQTPWHPGFVDAIITLGAADSGRLDRAVENLRQDLGSSIEIEATEKSRVWRNRNGRPIEHFGYVDGISNPRFFGASAAYQAGFGTLDGYLAARQDTPSWDPGFPLDVVAADCPMVDGCHGSYLVYRKLEQNVHSFKAAEEELAELLGLSGSSAERAGGLVVGRMESGAPVRRTPGAREDPAGTGVDEIDPSTPPNDFTFSEGYSGCPLSSHIRKVNGRTSADRGRIMTRRGMTYGRRGFDEDTKEFTEPWPTGDVGLLFAANVADIANQFEAAQVAANGPADSIDPVIGQNRGQGTQTWTDPIANATAALDFRNHVSLIHGEYFYAPSIEALQQLADGKGSSAEHSSEA